MNDYYLNLIGKPILWADSTGTLNKGILLGVDEEPPSGLIQLPEGVTVAGSSKVWIRLNNIQDPAARKARQHHERFGV